MVSPKRAVLYDILGTVLVSAVTTYVVAVPLPAPSLKEMYYGGLVIGVIIALMWLLLVREWIKDIERYVK